MSPHIQTEPTPYLGIDASKLPALIDIHGINQHLAPLARSTLYALAGAGEIESASVGLRRGRRLFVTASIIAWLERRAAQTRRPKGASSE